MYATASELTRWRYKINYLKEVASRKCITQRLKPEMFYKDQHNYRCDLIACWNVEACLSQD
jgi:hypothetical protein